MEPLWTMTQLNDFIFCPRSLYYSGIYKNTGSVELYHQAPQLNGKAAHAAVDEARYSSRKDMRQGITVHEGQVHEGQTPVNTKYRTVREFSRTSRRRSSIVLRSVLRKGIVCWYILFPTSHVLAGLAIR